MTGAYCANLALQVAFQRSSLIRAVDLLPGDFEHSSHEIPPLIQRNIAFIAATPWSSPTAVDVGRRGGSLARIKMLSLVLLGTVSRADKSRIGSGSVIRPAKRPKIDGAFTPCDILAWKSSGEF